MLAIIREVEVYDNHDQYCGIQYHAGDRFP